MSIKGIFNGLFNTEEEEDESFEEEAHIEKKEKEIKTEEKTMAYTENRAEAARAAAPKTTSNAIELKVVRPESFNSVGQIADYLLNHCTVVLNLEATSKDTALRIVDFLNGVAYAIDGQIKSVTNSTYIITPNNVSVSGEMLTGAKAAAKPGERDSFDNF
ncbi:MAG: cell division protein SepF [Clostridia bacterium]|nr:cell division protein SepF [Clostridia bacterium]MBQ8382923.1 cell division protein SepF [Clostridia bacterium]